MRDEIKTGTDVKVALTGHSLSQQWLRVQLNSRGIVCDNAQLCRAISGINHGRKSAELIAESARIIADYETRFLGARE